MHQAANREHVGALEPCGAGAGDRRARAADPGEGQARSEAQGRGGVGAARAIRVASAYGNDAMVRALEAAGTEPMPEEPRGIVRREALLVLLWQPPSTASRTRGPWLDSCFAGKLLQELYWSRSAPL